MGDYNAADKAGSGSDSDSGDRIGGVGAESDDRGGNDNLNESAGYGADTDAGAGGDDTADAVAVDATAQQHYVSASATSASQAPQTSQARSAPA